MKSRVIPLLMLVSTAAWSVGSALPAMAGVLGVSSDVKGSVTDVSQHAQDVFKQMGINKTQQSATTPSYQQTLEGKKGDMDVKVEMKQTAANQTHVDVIAKQGTLKWNQDYAQNVLSKIIQSG